VTPPRQRRPAGDFVRDEAGQAKARNILVPVVIKRTRIPLGFGEMQAICRIGEETPKIRFSSTSYVAATSPQAASFGSSRPRRSRRNGSASARAGASWAGSKDAPYVASPSAATSNVRAAARAGDGEPSWHASL
jgi:hypothetical protein